MRLTSETTSAPVRTSNAWGTAGFEVALIGLLLSFGLLSPLGLALSVVGLRRAPRGLALIGVVLGLLGSIWLVVTLLVDEPLRYDSGPYGTVHVLRGAAGAQASEQVREQLPPGPLRVEVRGGRPGAKVELFFAEERFAYRAFMPDWEGKVRGIWWLGVSPRPAGTLRSDDAGDATFEVVFPRGLAGELVRLQAVVHPVPERPDDLREFTDAVRITVEGGGGR